MFILLGIVAYMCKKETLGAIFELIALIAVLTNIAHWALSYDPKESTVIEYNASEYNLDYKIIEFQEQKDTIYVLTAKEFQEDK